MKHTRLKLALITTALISGGAYATSPTTNATGHWDSGYTQAINSATGVANLSVNQDTAPLTVNTVGATGLTTTTAGNTTLATFTVSNSATSTSVCFSAPTVSGANAAKTFGVDIASGSGEATTFNASTNNCANEAENAVLTVKSPALGQLDAGYTQISATATIFSK